MSSNTSDPFQNKSDDPSEKVRKTRGDLDETKNVLVTTTNPVVKEGNTDMVTKPNVVKEAITPLTTKKTIDTVNKKEKPQASNITVYAYISNTPDKVKSLDK